jgi:hypothetical protein
MVAISRPCPKDATSRTTERSGRYLSGFTGTGSTSLTATFPGSRQSVSSGQSVAGIWGLRPALLACGMGPSSLSACATCKMIFWGRGLLGAFTIQDFAGYYRKPVLAPFHVQILTLCLFSTDQPLHGEEGLRFFLVVSSSQEDIPPFPFSLDGLTQIYLFTHRLSRFQ